MFLYEIFQSSDEENEDIKKDKPRLRVHSSSNRKQLSVQEVNREEDGNDNRERKISEYASGNESDVFLKGNYRKVTRLSSEQIVSDKDYHLKNNINIFDKNFTPITTFIIKSSDYQDSFVAEF